MKSAYELAMERLEKSEPSQKLTESQRAEIQELNNRYEAKLAERETFLNGLIIKAEASGNIGEVAELQDQLQREAATIREEWDVKKEKVWKKDA